MVGRHVEDSQHLVEHLAVLARHGHDGLELLLARLQLVDERAHLDCLRAGAEDEHDSFHIIPRNAFDSSTVEFIYRFKQFFNPIRSSFI